MKVIAANDITALIITIPMIFYLNKKHKAFWCGLGQMIAALANFLPLLAYMVVPGSYVAKSIESKEEMEFCTRNHDSVTEVGSYSMLSKENINFWNDFIAACACSLYSTMFYCFTMTFFVFLDLNLH